jgi:hypothetical protein
MDSGFDPVGKGWEITLKIPLHRLKKGMRWQLPRYCHAGRGQ